jgi:hypothetical protein
MAQDRKQYPLRLPHDLYEAYERWAADEFRSVNAQIEAALVDAARRAGRLRRSRRPPADTTGDDTSGTEPPGG